MIMNLTLYSQSFLWRKKFSCSYRNSILMIPWNYYSNNINKITYIISFLMNIGIGLIVFGLGKPQIIQVSGEEYVLTAIFENANLLILLLITLEDFINQWLVERHNLFWEYLKMQIQQQLGKDIAWWWWITTPIIKDQTI